MLSILLALADTFGMRQAAVIIRLEQWRRLHEEDLVLTGPGGDA